MKIRVFDKETKSNITNEVDACTENISKGGMCLILPKSWDCPECNNCLGWVYNLGCKLKKDTTNDDNRSLTEKLNLKISLSDPSISSKEPIQLEGDCVWVSSGDKSKEDVYPVGVALLESNQKKVSTYFSSLLNP